MALLLPSTMSSPGPVQPVKMALDNANDKMQLGILDAISRMRAAGLTADATRAAAQYGALGSVLGNIDPISKALGGTNINDLMGAIDFGSTVDQSKIAGLDEAYAALADQQRLASEQAEALANVGSATERAGNVGQRLDLNNVLTKLYSGIDEQMTLPQVFAAKKRSSGGGKPDRPISTTVMFTDPVTGVTGPMEIKGTSVEDVAAQARRVPSSRPPGANVSGTQGDSAKSGQLLKAFADRKAKPVGDQTVDAEGNLTQRGQFPDGTTRDIRVTPDGRFQVSDPIQ